MIPTEEDDIHTPQNKPRIHILSPTSGSAHNPRTPINFQLMLESVFPVRQVDYFINGLFQGSRREGFGRVGVDISNVEMSDEPVTIRFRVYDTVGNTGEAELSIRIEP